jgi:NAD(P)-dependent dehydrogenase (short-subunit alcohol dehydrogenase family)
MGFEQKVVLITGAARGIGRAIAQQFATQGATVALHYNTHQTEAEKTLASLTGTGHALFQADLSCPAEVEQFAKSVLARWGRIDVLVNNAAVYLDHPIQETSYDLWQTAWHQTLDVNLMAAANLMFWVSQQMRNQGGGRIVNISSRGAFRGEPTAPAYGASKAALNALSQSLAQALAPDNIFVYVVAPGFVETERVAYKLNDEIRRQSPLRRVAYPDEVARTVLFLASEGTDFLTGCIVDVNGASYLRS